MSKQNLDSGKPHDPDALVARAAALRKMLEDLLAEVNRLLEQTKNFAPKPAEVCHAEPQNR